MPKAAAKPAAKTAAKPAVKAEVKPKPVAVAPGKPATDQYLLLESGQIRLRQTRQGPLAYIKSDMYIGRCLELYGEFSPGEGRFFSQILKPGMWALDVGANIGVHSVLFGQKVGPTGRVISFEPQRIINQLLSTNVALNGLFNVQTKQVAVSSAPGKLIVPQVNYFSESNFGALGFGGQKWEVGEEVPVITLDSLNLPACHFIKIDVEGMETEVLKGATETLKKHRPILYVENDRIEKSHELITLLWGAGYRLYWHMTPYFYADNFYGSTENPFPGIASFNMVCVPKEYSLVISGAREVKSAHEDWEVILGKKPLPA